MLFTCVDEGPSGVLHARRHRSEDPHQRQQKFVSIATFRETQSRHIDAFWGPQSDHIDKFKGTQSRNICTFSVACRLRIIISKQLLKQMSAVGWVHLYHPKLYWLVLNISWIEDFFYIYILIISNYIRHMITFKRWTYAILMIIRNLKHEFNRIIYVAFI